MRVRLVAPVVAALLGAVLASVPAAADPTNTSTVTTAAVKSVRVTPDRVWWIDTSNVLHVQDADTSVSPAALGSPYAWTATVGTVGLTATPVYSATGNRVAYLDPASPVIHLRDMATGAQSTTPSITGLTSVKLSGSNLEIDTPTAVYIRNLGTGSQLTFPASATLSGRYVAYFANDCSVWRKDLISGAAIRVRAPGPAVNQTTCNVNAPLAVKMRGDWVYWKLSCELRGVNLATQALATDMSASCLKKFSLLEGWLVYKDSTGVVQAQDLTTAPAPVALTTNPVSGYSVEDHALSWYNANGLYVGAVQLPGYNPSTRLSDATTPAAFSPNGDGRQDTWTPSFTASADFAWSLAISKAGVPVTGSPITGTAKYGVIAPTWAPGADVADGTYTWTLTSMDGTVVNGTDGAGGGLSGTVVVRRTGLSGSVSAPLVTSTAKTNLYLPLKLTATTPTGYPGYGPIGYTLQILDNGVLRTTSTTSTLPAILGAQGHTYRVRVQVRDNAGNVGAWSGYATTAVPLDDRSTSLRYSTGWTTAASSSSFLGTLRIARAAGRAVSVRTTLSRVAVVVVACPTCGKIRLYVDGHYITTVDTYATRTTYRKIVLLRTVATSDGLHTVALIVAGTAGRPSVYLDAIAGIR